MRKTGQLKYKDRVIIQNCLEENISISKICKKLRVPKHTIYREIHRNSKEVKPNKPFSTNNIVDCKNRMNCPYLYNAEKKYYEIYYVRCKKYIKMIAIKF